MAKHVELTPDEWRQAEAWIASRPPAIQAMIRRWPPDRWYWLDPPGQYAVLISYGEDETVRVLVSGRHNKGVARDREVCGVDPNNLTECDAPREV